MAQQTGRRGLEIRHIAKRYPRTEVLKDINMRLNPGSSGLLGKNGAGKTTLLKILCGLLKADAGEVRYCGHDIQSLQEQYRNKVGYLPQKFGCYSTLTAEEFLFYMAELKGLGREQQRENMEQLIRKAGIAHFRHKKMGQLSGGMRQSVGIAQALLGDPEILIFDEPTVGLDPGERMRFQTLVEQLAAEKIIIISTHIISDIAMIADRVMVLQNGELSLGERALRKQNKNKVWSCTLPRKEARLLFAQYADARIVKVEGDRIELHLAADQKPHEKAVRIDSQIEDFFLG